MDFAEIARIEEHRQAHGTAEIAQESEAIAGGVMCFSGKGSWANQAAGLGHDGPVTESEIDRLVQYYVSRGVEPQIEVAATADASLIAGLETRGFTLREFENILYRRVAGDEELREAMPNPWPEGLVIERVDPSDSDAVNEHVRTASMGFVPEGEEIPEVNFQLGVRMVESPNCAAFTARMDGVVVGAGAMEVSTEISCLFGTSVLPAYRRRGIQGALIVRRLEHVRDSGCRLAVIHSEPGIPTERNAMRLGFGLAYSKAVLRMRGEGLEPSH